MSQKLRRQNLSEWQILKRHHERVLKYATLDIFPVNSTVIYDRRTFICTIDQNSHQLWYILCSMTLICCKNCIDVCLKKTENKRKGGREFALKHY